MEPRLNGIWLQTGLRPGSKLDSIMEFGRYHAPNRFGACSEPALNRFGASSKPANVMEFGTNQLQTSSEPASVMEFGTNQLQTSSEAASIMEFGF